MKHRGSGFRHMHRAVRVITLAAAVMSVAWVYADRSWSACGGGGDLRSEIAATPEKSGGIYYAYPVTSDSAATPPAGYEPVLLNHYGRHGSRWAINLSQYPEVDSIFREQQEAGNLTPLGEETMMMAREAGMHARGHSGELSPLGERQHKAIASRMLNRYPTLFADSARIEAYSSTEPRCIVSMAAFCESLKSHNQALRIQRHATPGDMDFIAYSTPEAKEQGKMNAGWRKKFHHRYDSLTHCVQTASRLFKNPSKVRHLSRFMRKLHDIAIAVQDVDGLDTDILGVFTPEDLYDLWQANNHIMYYRHGNAGGNGGHGLRSARSLLLHLISESDSLLQSGAISGIVEGKNGIGESPKVVLHFGHDTNLIRLLALADFEGCAEYCDNPDGYASAWQAFRVSPMGANLQMVFFKNGEGDVIVSLRHNEQPAYVAGIAQIPGSPGFYDWERLKGYWMERASDILTSENLTSRPSVAVNSLLERLEPGASERFVIREDSSMPEGFTIGTADGKPSITANNAVNAATGLNWYLKYHAGTHLSWNTLEGSGHTGRSVLPTILPLPEKPETHTTTATRRYYLNYCTHSYSMAFWDWERWEKEIDWMALHGINMPLAITGTDVVWRNTLRRLGYSDSECDSFIAGPAFQAWWLMNNLEGWGGPNSEAWYESRADLQRKILARMREYGMEPVLPGYSGMVPHDADTRLGVEVSGKGIWNGFTRPAFLKTTDPMFDKIADIYYDELTRLCGTSRYYSMDPFHEGGSLEGVDLGECGKIISAAMKRANPEAIWVIQGWNENPRAELLAGVQKGEIVVLDLASEIKPNWGDPDTPSPYKRPDGFAPHEWVYCMLLNFGGNVGLHGRIDCVADGYYKALSSPYAGALTGVGITAEGIGNNPVMYELLSELMWRPEKFDKKQWIKDYATARYGGYDSNVAKGWEKLASTIYNCPSGNLQQGTTESIFCARPSMNVWQVSSWSRMKPYYEPQDVIDAALLFAKGAAKFGDNENYVYDLVDITRQGMAEKGRLTYLEMTDAIRRHDRKGFDKSARRFMDLLDGQERLLNTRREFKVGSWIEAARNLGVTPEEKDLMEENARLLITTWGRRTASEDGGLRDYAHREWGGVMGDLYRERWATWIERQKALMAAGIYPDATGEAEVASEADYTTTLPASTTTADTSEGLTAPIDFYEIDSRWVDSRKHYPSAPEGDAVRVARELQRLLR